MSERSYEAEILEELRRIRAAIEKASRQYGRAAKAYRTPYPVCPPPFPDPTCNLDLLCEYVDADAYWATWVDENLVKTIDQVNAMCVYLKSVTKIEQLSGIDCTGGGDTTGKPPKPTWPPD